MEPAALPVRQVVFVQRGDIVRHDTNWQFYAGESTLGEVVVLRPARDETILVAQRDAGARPNGAPAYA